MSGWRLDQADKAAWARKARDAGMRPGHIVLALGISREELDVLLGEKLL